MKMQSIILLGAIILSGFNLVEAQTDGDAKNLYYAYTPRRDRRQPASTNRTAVVTRTTTTSSSRRRNSNGNRRNQTTAANNRNSNSETSAPTGLPGTKITIELLRNGKLRFVRPTFTFRSGDKIRLRLKTNFEGFVSVLNVGSSGDVNLLYPVRGLNNYIKPTSDYQIPQGDGWIVFDNQSGTEIVSVIMSEDQLEGLGSLDSNSDYFRKDRTSKDLFTQTSGNDFYAVFREQEAGENVGFTLKLKHK
jgi:hypothetical protein